MTFLLIALATCYIAYVLARSDFPPVETVRVAVFTKWGEGSAPAYLATCPWCVSFYAAGAVTLGAVLTSGLAWPVLVWLGAAAASGAFHVVIDLLTSVTTLADRRTKLADEALRR